MVLTASGLAGIFSFVPLPWNEDYELDEPALRNDLEYLCSTGLSGVYTPDSSGEFFTLEFDEFRRIVDVVVDVVAPTDKPVQIGCHWTSERGAIRRARYAADSGADAVRFSFPYWEEVTVEEALRFVEAVGDATDPVPLVHYNTPKAKLVFGADEYRRATERVPNLIGTKQLIRNPFEVTEILDAAPELAHFVDESLFAQGMAAGASGMYAWLSAINPRLSMEWYDACAAGDWGRAMEIQTTVNRYRAETLAHWSCSSMSAAFCKLDAALNPNFECHPRVRPPYESGTEADVEWARRWARENAPELLEQ